MRFPRLWRRKTETRSATGYTALSMLARAEAITGVQGQAELTATVQTAVSLWESGLSMADVSGTDLLTPPLLAHMARSLALRGEWVGLIEDDGLTPAADWDLSTSLSRPRAYRLSLPDEGGGRSVTALSGEVCHVILAPDLRSPWRGSSPLRRASLSADLLSTLEAALAETYAAAPLGSLVNPVPEMTEEDRARLAGSFRGQRGRVLLRESATVTAAGGPAPMTDWRPQSLSPALRDTMATETLEDAKRAILSAYGVLPALVSPNATGPLVREAQRHLATWQLQPVAKMVAAEMTAKLGADVALDTLRPVQAWDAGGRARAAQGIISALADAKAAGLDVATVSKAFAQVGWDMGRD